MQIRYIDGIRLRRALIAGGSRLLRFKDELDRINVFPVPDSDTGTNMAGTIGAVINRLRQHRDRSIASTTRMAADAALMGARGNSGAILAQFFHGLAEELKGQFVTTTHAFAVAVYRAANYAYTAISEPKEGTILSVIRSWGARFSEATQRKTDLIHSMQDSLRAAKEALKATRDKLPSLRRANVVDAGALGFVHLIEGVYQFTTSGRIKDAEQIPEPVETEGPKISGEYLDEITYRYCTECIIEGSDIDSAALRKDLASLGDSLIVAGSGTKARIHIHTDTPNAVFEIAERFGQVGNHKADDMEKQFATAHTAHGDIALVIDSACDMPKELREKPYVTMVPLSLYFGDHVYIDKYGLTPAGFYELLRKHPDEVPRTSQPSPQDYRKQYEFLTSHYPHVLTVALSGALSGTFNAATRAIPEDADNVTVVDSRNVSVGIGLILEQLIRAMEDGAGIREATQIATSLVHRTKILVAIPTVDWLVRGGRLKKSQAALARTFGLVPLVKLDADGRAVRAGVALSFPRALRKVVRTLEASLPKDRPIPFAFAHVNNEADAEGLRREVAERFQFANEGFIEAAAPVLASHTGFGTVAVAYIEPEQ